MEKSERLDPKWKDTELWQDSDSVRESLKGKKYKLELEQDVELDFNVWTIRNRGRKGFGG